ncbi:MAG: DUF3999 family protein [Candidatus Falkowbacteria bacterium]
MRKKILLSFLVLWSFTIVSFADADFTPSGWQYKKSIELTNSGLEQLSLDQQVFQHARPDLADLRIVTNDGQEVAYIINLPVDQHALGTLFPRLLNNSYLPGKFTSVVLDLGESGKITNSLLIRTHSENFRRNVTLCGSNTTTDWQVLRDKAYVYDYTDVVGRLKAQNTRINFPESAFRYYKLEVADENNVGVAVDSVEITQESQLEAEKANQPLSIVSTANTNDRTTEIIMSPGISGLPLSEVSLQSDSVNFNRGVIVFASTNLSGPWAQVGTGYIFRYQTPLFTGENLTVSINETRSQFIKMVIYNQDNPAINILGASALFQKQSLYFQAEFGKTYALYYGNQLARQPNYDLSTYLQYLEPNKAMSAALAAEATNVQYQPPKPPVKPLTERQPLLLPGAMILCAGLLLFMVYRFLKK